jgi:hypothetical protein
MGTKFVILAIISALLVPTIYSSSTSVVFADVSCIDYDKKTKVCATSGGDMYDCVKQDDGKWKCTKIPSANVPPGLSDALDDVTAAKAPKTLNEAEVPEQQSGDNMTFSRANINALE